MKFPLVRFPQKAPCSLGETMLRERADPAKRLFVVLDDSDVSGPPEEAAWRVVVVSEGLWPLIHACGVPYYDCVNPKSYQGAYAVPRWVRVLLDFAQTNHGKLAPVDWEGLFAEAPKREDFLSSLIALTELRASASNLAHFLLEHFPLR